MDFDLHLVTSDDVAYLRRALALAVRWDRDQEELDVDRILAPPELRYLLDSWGREGDVGLIATRGARPLGAAWFRLWTREKHSYGFVDETTPELAVAVEPQARGQGVGTGLLRRLFRLSREAGFARLSLSVAAENPALRLYERLGFRRCGTSGTSVTMVLDLFPPDRATVPG